MTTAFTRVYGLAEKGHAPQKRKGNGLPYFTHPVAVTEAVERVLVFTLIQRGYSDPAVTHALQIEIYKIVAILHDYFEDVVGVTDEAFAEMERILLAYLPPAMVKTIIVALRLLSKKKGESYWHYLNRIKENEIARFVKLRDLEHNMSDLEEGNLLDKYRLAYYYLSN
jgi:(p)ppGpp synthase/HD superfamily hydrolase